MPHHTINFLLYGNNKRLMVLVFFLMLIYSLLYSDGDTPKWSLKHLLKED